MDEWGPGLRTQRRIGQLDTLQGTYINSDPSTPELGTAVPDYPGMLCEDVVTTDDGCGTYEHRVSAVGNLYGSRPQKLIKDRKTRSNDPNWDSSVRDLYHDCWDELTGTASTAFNGINNLTHRFHMGDPVVITSVGGSCGLAVGTIYYVQALNGNLGFRLSATLGGSAVTITGNVTVTVAHKDLARGQAHPKQPGMFLFDVDTEEDEVLPWALCRCSYRGIYGPKPYKRSISVNGKTISGDSFKVGFPGGGWEDFRRGTAQQPTLEVSDIQAFAIDPDLYQFVPTSDIFNVAEEEDREIPDSILIPDPPDVNPIFGLVFGDNTVSQWPNHWSFVGCERVDSLPGSTIVLIRKVWRYEWPLTLG